MSRFIKQGKYAAIAFVIIGSMFAGFMFIGAGHDSAVVLACDTPVTYMTPVDTKVSASNDVKDPEQIQNAKTIIGIGLARGFKSRDIKIALIVALIESRLINVRYGDRDSLGLFQQRPSVKVWGTADQILDPVHATNKFYDALAGIKNRDARPEPRVAYLVQRPGSETAYTQAYNTWESDAVRLMGTLPDTSSVNLATSTVVLPQAGCGSYGESNPALIAVQAALSEQNKPYSFGSKSNPLSDDGGAGFTKWAWAKAGVTLPAIVAGQHKFGAIVKEASASVGDVNARIKALKPGDLLYWESSGTSPPSLVHVALYVGNGNVIDSTALNARISVKPIQWNGFGRQYSGATRPPIPNNATNLKDGWTLPVKSARVTSPFGMRFHPTQHRWMLHDGVDFVAPLGTPIFAAHDGTVIAPFGTGFGNQVILDHGGGVVSGYAHLSKFAPGITIGAKIKQGQLVGYAGSTGWSTGSHLHFRILVNRVAVNPIPFLRSHGLVL